MSGVFDNRTTMRRERWYDGILTSSLPCNDAMRENKFFPWGCFEDLPKAPEPIPRVKAETERWLFIGKWCKERGLSPRVADNFNAAALEWAAANCSQAVAIEGAQS